MTSSTVTAREANQRFSEILRGVETGRSYLVTRRGKPVARIEPVLEAGVREVTPEQEAACQRILATEWHLGSEPFDRDSLHER